MRKLWVVLSIIVVLSLMWCTIPSVGGWSWASDPVFDFDGQIVNVIVGLDREPDEGDLRKIKVTLRVPDDTDVDLVDDCGLKVKIKDNYDAEGQAKLRVTVPGKYYLEGVTVEGTDVLSQRRRGNTLVLTIALPQ